MAAAWPSAMSTTTRIAPPRRSSRAACRAFSAVHVVSTVGNWQNSAPRVTAKAPRRQLARKSTDVGEAR